MNLHVVCQHGMAGELCLALLTDQIWLLGVLKLANVLTVVFIVWLQLGLQNGERTSLHLVYPLPYNYLLGDNDYL